MNVENKSTQDPNGDIIVKITGKEENRFKNEFRKALKLTNLAFVLSDVVNTCVMDAHDELLKVGMEFRHEDRMKFNRMKSTVKAAEVASKLAAATIYKLPDADDAVVDSDYLYDLLNLVMDKIGDNKEKEESLMQYLQSMTDEKVVIE